MRPRLIISLGLVVAFVSCTEGALEPTLPQAQFAVSDGANNGNEHFYFLPPMVSAPSFSGSFDATVTPVVRITENGSLLTELDAALNSDDEQYHANWHTDEFDLDPTNQYRITVLLGNTELGFIDVVVGSTGKDLKGVNTDENIALKDGRTLPIKFRVEEGAVLTELVWVTMEGTPAPTTSGFHQMWGSSASDIYVTGPGLGTVSHFNGNAWTTVSFGFNGGTGDVWGLSSSEIYVASGNFANQNVLAFGNITDGFSPVPNYPQQGVFTAGVWGTSSTNIHTVGPAGRAFRFDGNSWQSLPTPTSNTLEDVKGADAQNVFAVGANATVLHFDGNAWSSMAIPAGITGQINAVWAASASDVFAVGGDGVIIHYDGTQWSTMSSGTTLGLGAIFGISPTDIMASGADGIILHYDGVDWNTMDSGVPDGLGAVWGASPTEWFATSSNGFILKTIVQ